MERTFLRTEHVTVGDETVQVRFFEVETKKGLRRFSAEILLGPRDRIILDDDSASNLEARAMRLVPASIYSRVLARATAA